MSEYVISGISLPLCSPEEEAISAAAKKLRKCGILPLQLTLYRKSIDAREKSDIRLVYGVRFKTEGTLKDAQIKKLSLSCAAKDTLNLKSGSQPLGARVVVVGMGPCGLFAALLLAKMGYRPLVIERGEDVDKRVAAVEKFNNEGILDTNSNIQFGAGGAGTFSDGKLVTRINDSRCAYVLSTLYALGAPKEILTLAKPHIGTDILRTVVKNGAEEIIKHGGEILYNTSFLGFGEFRDGIRTIHTTKGDIAASVTVLAIGHSARDTYEALIKSGRSIVAKDFSVGFRIEHLKSHIDSALYGAAAGHPSLPYAEYNLSHNTKVRGVYTFCMCPGGEVVAGASEVGGLCVNGMSHYARNGRNSNSAICVSVFKNDFDGTPMGAIEFQRKLERAAFEAGGGDYFAPVMSVSEYLGLGKGDSSVTPTYRGGKVREANLHTLLPSVLDKTLSQGLVSFGKKIRDFDKHGVLSGTETRTSSPLRILRGEDLTLAGESDIYPGGEGAGYAGGITSAAVDGIKIAEMIIERYKPFD